MMKPRIREIKKRGTTEGHRRHLVYCPGYLDEFNKWNTGYFCPARALKQDAKPSDCCSSAKIGKILGQGHGTPCSCCCRRSSNAEFFPESSHPKQKHSDLNEMFGQYTTTSYDDIWNWKAISNKHQDFESSALMDNDAKYRSFMACFLSLGMAPLLLLLCFIVFITLYHIKHQRAISNRKPSHSNLFIINIRKPHQSVSRPISELPDDTVGNSSTSNSTLVGRTSAFSGLWSRVPFICELIGRRDYVTIDDSQSTADEVIPENDGYHGNTSVTIDNKTSNVLPGIQQCNCRFKWLQSRERLWKKIAGYVKNILYGIPGYEVNKHQESEQL